MGPLDTDVYLLVLQVHQDQISAAEQYKIQRDEKARNRKCCCVTY